MSRSVHYQLALAARAFARHGRDLYVVRSSCGWIKIGRTNNIARRIQERAFVPPSVELEVLAVHEGLGPYERSVHLALEAYRSHGEWFRAECLEHFADGMPEFIQRIGGVPSNQRSQGVRRPGDGRCSDGERWTTFYSARARTKNEPY